MQEAELQNELAAAQACAESNPTSADNWNRLAIIQLKLGNLEAAAQNMGQAIANEPDEALHYSNRGRILFALKRAEEALADYSKALELALSEELYSSRSVVNIALNKPAAALGDLNDALELNLSVQNLLNRAVFYTNRGMAVDALRDVSQVIEMQPDDPNHYLTRANLAFALSRQYPEFNEMGLSDIEKVVALDHEGILRPALLQMTNVLEASIATSPNSEVARRLIKLIRSGGA